MVVHKNSNGTAVMKLRNHSRWRGILSEDNMDGYEAKDLVEDIDTVKVDGVFPIHRSFLLPRTLQSDTRSTLFVHGILQAMFLQQFSKCN